MNEQIKKILKMVEEGKINSDQATELIDALREKDNESGEQSGAKPQHLKIKVISKSGKNIDLKVPVKFIKGIIKATGKLPIYVDGKENIDMNVITEAIDNNLTGKILELKTDSGEYVEIYID
jgi:hypothetical protein